MSLFCGNKLQSHDKNVDSFQVFLDENLFIMCLVKKSEIGSYVNTSELLYLYILVI